MKTSLTAVLLATSLLGCGGSAPTSTGAAEGKASEGSVAAEPGTVAGSTEAPLPSVTGASYPHSGPIPTSAPEAMTRQERAVYDEFLAAAHKMDEDEQALFVGRSRVGPLRENLRRAAPGSLAEADLHDRLGRELLRLGENGAAVAEFQKALEGERRLRAAEVAAGIARGEATVYVERQRAILMKLILSALRLGDASNCIARHGATSCILPLGPEAVHLDRTGATTAMSYARELLELSPGDLKGIWFLNIAAMQAGVWPKEVPRPFLIPPERFTSKVSVGRFRNIAPALGIHTFDMAGGAVTDDFDGDGFIDVITSTCDPYGPLTYFRNAGDGSFVLSSRSAHLDSQLGGLNLMHADYDNDGRPDLLVLRGGWLGRLGKIRMSLLRNNGDGTFADVTRAAGLAEPALPTQAAAWADMDGDGDLDLYVGHEGEEAPDGTPTDFTATLYRNDGDGTFTDVTQQSGTSNDRFAKGVAWGDYDGDGDPDLYVSNIGPNRLYRNNGDGTFSDVAPGLGVTEPVGRSFATWFFDYDNDGDLDLWVGAFKANVADVAADLLGQPPVNPALWPRLYRNDGGRFTDVTVAAGLAHPLLPMGSNFGDINEDGYLDIYLGTGSPEYESLMPNVMFLNNGDGTFTDVTFSGGFGHLQKGHGVAFADLDNDGDVDIFEQMGGFFPGDRFNDVLFENPGHGRHFVSIKAVGTRSNRAAIGARLHLRVATPHGERAIYRWVGTGGSFGGSSLEQSIGLGDGTKLLSLEVDWPGSGTHQTFTNIPLDSFVRMVEGEPNVRLESRRRLRLGS